MLLSSLVQSRAPLVCGLCAWACGAPSRRGLLTGTAHRGVDLLHGVWKECGER